MSPAKVIHKRVLNFSAGPAALPLPVLEQIQEELINYQGVGMSVMEMSHRSKAFQAIKEEAEQTLREILNIPDDYSVLFLQGGASLQFSMLPINLKQDQKVAQLVNTGSWTQKALKEIKKETTVNVVASSEEQNFLCLPDLNQASFDSNASFVYMASNNTIFGTQFKQFPKTEAPLVVDMSSDILSRPLDVSQFGCIFAGAQKNIGPAGLTLVIIKNSLLERCDDSVSSMLQYKIHADKGSLYNTPPSFGIYIAGLVFKWIKNQGGLSVVQEKNEVKAKLLYNAIDQSDMFYCPIPEKDRSLMNVVFRVKDNNVDLETAFVKDAEAAGISSIKGHRSVGGLRASIYNAQPLENIEALIEFMHTFEKRN